MNASKLSELRGVHVAVWGAGREGAAAAAVLTHQECAVTVVVDAPHAEAETLAALHGARVITPADIAGAGVDFVVRSPGISRYRDEIATWSAAGIGSSGLFALWLADQDPERVVAVTGTKGKSTTATLVAAVLRAAGHEVHVAGNIGIPVTEIPPTGIAVVEVSSYQAADCTVSPAVGVLTSLGEDHVTWHQSVENYHADKLRLFGGVPLRAAVCDGSVALVEKLTSVGVRTIVDGPWRTEGGTLVAGDQMVDAAGVTAQVRRNLAVAANAATCMDAAVNASHLAATLAGFEPLPSRQREIAVVDGVRWVDDLLASNPTGVLAAVESFSSSPLVLLMGGADRGIDVSPIVAALSHAGHVRAVILMGDEGEPLVDALRSTTVPVVRIEGHDIAAAVDAARHIAEPGDVVSFSPGAPTPARLGTWEDRSREFARLVAELDR
ncbi:MAG: UDP-N-acetylmuramoyl-L-alanine--D-glutamate ligase [Ilumatobacteraceae bacterium]